jgi:ribonucleotide reductase alpha subunit
MIIEAEKYYRLINPKYISWDFYSDYIEQEPPFGELGVIVFLRTYSRFIESLQRREYWREVCLRVVEYSLSLDITSTEEWKTKEAEELFDAMFNLQGFPAGRSLWTAGTKQSQVDSSCAWNCTFRVIDDISSFSEIFYWLMIGAGTGFSVEEKYISKLPTFKRIPIEHLPYQEIQESLRYDNTNVSWFDSTTSQYSYHRYDKTSLTEPDFLFKSVLIPLKGSVTINIGDSKEGWCNALRAYLLLLSSSKDVSKIVFNYNNIRPEGSRIKTFGGRSSGHSVLIELFDNIDNIIKNLSGLSNKLTSTNVLDIVNSIGLGVVSGGVELVSA